MEAGVCLGGAAHGSACDAGEVLGVRILLVIPIACEVLGVVLDGVGGVRVARVVELEHEGAVGLHSGGCERALCCLVLGEPGIVSVGARDGRIGRAGEVLGVRILLLVSVEREVLQVVLDGVCGVASGRPGCGEGDGLGGIL